MRTVVKSQVPFLADGETASAVRRLVFETNPGYLRIRHLPVRNKAFAEYTIDCENPCPELCTRTETETEILLELRPVPLALPTVCLAEKTFSSGNLRCSARLLRRAGCYSVSLDSPDFCETFVCDPLSAEVSLEIYEIDAPLVGILEDRRRLTLFSCLGDFKIVSACDCTDLRYDNKCLTFRRHYADSRKRFEDVRLTASGGEIRTERLSFGFSSRKKVHEELFPLYFLESLFEGFEEEAKSYLDESLQSADLSAMREFFGECDRIRLSGERVELERNGCRKPFFFDFNDKKICNFRD